MTRTIFQRTFAFAITLHVQGSVVQSASGPVDGVVGAHGDLSRSGHRALDGKRALGIESIVWSGRDLLISRGMRIDPDVSLIRELIEVNDMRLTMFDAVDQPVRAWRIEHEGLRDRGFDFMHCGRDETAREVVCALNASLYRIEVDAAPVLRAAPPRCFSCGQPRGPIA